jgi:stigma-specific protein Stig1
MRRNTQRILLIAILSVPLAALVGGILAWAATKSVDLDGNGTAESSVALNVLTTFPAKIENVVTNKAVGDSFTFSYLSSGPGGWNGSVGLGTSTGIGTKWTWQTSQAVYSFTGTTCTNDICFSATAGLPSGTKRGPFSVPGRSLSPSGVTLSSSSLTSSLITFFSPPKTIVSFTSTVGQPGSGQVKYTTSVGNNTGGDLAVHLDAGPPGCCPHENQLNCSGTCVDYLTDESNCGGCGVQCAAGQFCDAGACVSSCPLGQTFCSGECVDTTSDPLNCGGCGIVCGTNQICTNSACFTCTSPQQTACDNHCTNIHTDPLNCGACGVNCALLCPSTGQGTCSNGNSCFCTTRAMSPNPAVSFTAASLLPPPAPVCETQAIDQSVPAGQSSTLGCNTAGFLAHEVLSIVKVCLDGSVPNPTTNLCADGTAPNTGPFMQLVPDPEHPVGTVDVAISPVAVGVDDPTKDGLWEPGELILLNVSVANSGSGTVTNACAKLTSPAQDLTPDDGVYNPVPVNIITDTACYPDIPGTPVSSGDCSSSPVVTPVRGLSSFGISAGSDYLGDTSRQFILHFTGKVNGVPISEDVPITLGIGSTCNPADIQGNFDGLQGLDSPMAQLIPEEDNRPLPLPNKPFSLGKTRPMKLSMSCGTVNLNDTQTLAPRITGLFNLTANQPVDITKININDSPNPYDPFFRFQTSSSGWIYNMRTRDLTAGRYRLTILIDGRKSYVTGFELKP